MQKRRGFLICPVRNSNPETQKAIAAYVEKQETDGVEMYWPARDTDQTDSHGWTICCHNRLAILDANEIHVWYDAASSGSEFDLGMLFAFFGLGWAKRVVISNPEAVKSTPYKSFENVLLKMRDEMEKHFALYDAVRKSATHPFDL